MTLPKQTLSSLENIYISPLEACNLNCKFCYTKKTKNILTNSQILSFISKYNKYLRSKNYDLRSIIFCGGEVFLLKNFTRLVNNLLAKKLFISIITNGTLDKLDQIKDPQNCQLLVSFDGPKNIHDKNRGAGNFNKTLKFTQHALSLGFPVEIFFLITKDSYPYKDSFNIFNLKKTYLTDRLMSLSPKQTIDIKTNYPTFPAKNFGCYQLSLQSNGEIFGCCESPTPLASLSDPINKIVKNFLNSLSPCQNCNIWRSEQFFSPQRMRGTSPKVVRTAKICSQAKTCNGCCNPSFLCNYKKELNKKSCKDVVKSFNA